MLLDLPPELINLIVGYLARPSSASHRCPCFAQNDTNRQLDIYDNQASAYETDALHFGLAHAYIEQCIVNGGWRGVVDALCFSRGKDIRLIPCVPDGFRGMIGYVLV